MERWEERQVHSRRLTAIDRAVSARRATTGFIFITLFLDILGIGLVIPIVPKLVESFVANDTAVASRYLGAFTAVYAFMQLIFSPVLGTLSDRFGRRPVLLISMVGQGIAYVLLALSPNLWWLFAGRIIGGITGASISTATAYIADVSPPEKRAANFGLVGMAFGLGFVAGPALGGFLGGFSLHLPFVVAAGLATTNALYGLFVLPESLSLEHRRELNWSKANPIGALRELTRYPIVTSLAFAIFFVSLAQRGMESNWVLYTGYRFGWSVRATGYSLALVGLTAAVVQGGLVRRVIPLIGERKAIMLGMSVGGIAFLLYGLSTQGWMMYAIIPFGALAGFAPPAAQAIMSRAVPVNEQGLLQGGLTSLNSLTMVLGPLIGNYSFSYFIGESAPVHLPGIAFLINTVFIVIGLLLALRTFSLHAEAVSPSAAPAPQ